MLRFELLEVWLVMVWRRALARHRGRKIERILGVGGRWDEVCSASNECRWWVVGCGVWVGCRSDEEERMRWATTGWER